MLLPEKKLQLRRQVHALKPVVIIGQNGLTAATHKAIDEALDCHELIKIRINAADQTERNIFIEEILRKHGAEKIKTVGHILAIYRKKPEV